MTMMMMGNDYYYEDGDEAVDDGPIVVSECFGRGGEVLAQSNLHPIHSNLCDDNECSREPTRKWCPHRMTGDHLLQ